MFFFVWFSLIQSNFHYVSPSCVQESLQHPGPGLRLVSGDSGESRPFLSAYTPKRRSRPRHLLPQRSGLPRKSAA